MEEVIIKYPLEVKELLDNGCTLPLILDLLEEKGFNTLNWRHTHSDCRMSSMNCSMVWGLYNDKEILKHGELGFMDYTEWIDYREQKFAERNEE